MKRIFKSKAELGEALSSPELQGRVLHMLVLHDDACGRATTGECNCSPWYELRDGTVENITEGAEMQADYFRKGLS